MWVVQFLGQHEYKGEWCTVDGCAYPTEEEALVQMAIRIFNASGYNYRVVKKES